MAKKECVKRVDQYQMLPQVVKKADDERLEGHALLSQVVENKGDKNLEDRQLLTFDPTGSLVTFRGTNPTSRKA